MSTSTNSTPPVSLGEGTQSSVHGCKQYCFSYLPRYRYADNNSVRTMLSISLSQHSIGTSIPSMKIKKFDRSSSSIISCQTSSVHRPHISSANTIQQKNIPSFHTYSIIEMTPLIMYKNLIDAILIHPSHLS